MSWLDRYAKRSAVWPEPWLGSKWPVRHVVELFGLHRDIVRQFGRRRLQRQPSTLPQAAPRCLVMDEFALYKGQRCATVVMDAETRRILWIGEGHRRETMAYGYRASGYLFPKIKAAFPGSP